MKNYNLKKAIVLKKRFDARIARAKRLLVKSLLDNLRYTVYG